MFKNIRAKLVRLLESYNPDVILLEDLMEKIDGLHDAIYLRSKITIDVESPIVKIYLQKLTYQIE